MSVESVLEDRYGVGGVAAPVYAVIWAAEHVAQTSGVAAARKQLTALNRKRERHGKSPAYPDYNSPLFPKRGNMVAKRKNAPKWRVRQRVRKALKKYVRKGNASWRGTKKAHKKRLARVPTYAEAMSGKFSKRRLKDIHWGQSLKNPAKVKGRKVKGGRAVTLKNFTGTIVRKNDKTVQILGRGRKR